MLPKRKLDGVYTSEEFNIYFGGAFDLKKEKSVDFKINSKSIPQKSEQKNYPKVKFLIFIFLWIILVGLIISFNYFSIKKPQERIYSVPFNQKTTTARKDFRPEQSEKKEEKNVQQNNFINREEVNIKNFGLKIEKIGIVVPIVPQVDGNQENIYNNALKKGVAHLKDSAFPGDRGNIFIFGHSSSTIRSPYSKIFARLSNLTNGDKIVVFYKNKEYIYYVFEKKVVEANDVSVAMPTEKEQLTLMTCWPIGTDKKRLIIKAAP